MLLSIPLIISCVVVSYLFGSVSSAVLVCRWLKYPDPRQGGSKNPGATNVLRVTGSKKAALLTLLGDSLKAFIPVLIAVHGTPAFIHWLNGTPTFGDLNGTPTLILSAWVLVGAFLGHLYPIFFGFQGGKGVATAFGGLLALSWPLGALVIATWLLTAVLFRISSLAALSAFIALPFYAYGLWHAFSLVLPLCVVSGVLIVRHRGNIERLMEGKEGKIGQKS